MGCLCLPPSSPQSHCMESGCDRHSEPCLRAARPVESRQALRPGKVRGRQKLAWLRPRAWPAEGDGPQCCRSLYTTEPTPTGNHSPTPSQRIPVKGRDGGPNAGWRPTETQSRVGQGELQGAKRQEPRVTTLAHAGATRGPGLRTRRQACCVRIIRGALPTD